MKNTVYDRLLRREVGLGRERYSGVRGIYGDRQWIEDMDIVNELEGHFGCVNALSWSKSGRLLASGSDDHRINIHSYQPEESTSQFSLTTSIMTGHSSNIFSVKFMPYSGDRTIVSATDDVRIFDIERSGHNLYGSAPSSSNGTAPSVRRRVDALTLTEGDTNAKAFRCHTDTVKRIVTEDNPFYFLTCSEDGDVRQWDIRQPSKAYPPAQSNSNVPSWARDPDATDNVPPPLISYSKYNLDLNTVSCSPSQPHYIALGGAHLHCFLHDRRMLGRDMLAERGGKLPSLGNRSEQDDFLLGQATRCVKKFAPNGTQRMGRNTTGHITACKISDADPNELIVSWSGDWIYSFDIMRSPDATEPISISNVSEGDHSHRVRDKGQKRKRTRSSVLSQEAAARSGSRQRTDSARASTDVHDGLALRVNYGNGQSEEIRIAPPEPRTSESEAAALRETDHYRIAKTTVKIQKQMFSLRGTRPATAFNGPDDHTAAFTSTLGFAASILPEMDEIARSWRYPVDPNEVDVALQNTLREHRESSRRFVQAAGTLARVLGGKLRTGSNSDPMISRYFATIQTPSNEKPLPCQEQFVYDFLKAIILWVDSGLGALVEGFSSAGSHPRLPLSPDADVDAIDDTLIPYLLQLAGDDPIVDMDASKFETDDRRILHSSEKAAVLAFARALKTPFADLSGAVVPASGCSGPNYSVQDRKQAISRWAFKVGRGALWNAAKSIRFAFVDRAYGGQGVVIDRSIRSEEQTLREQQEDVDPMEEDEVVVDAELVSRSWAEQSPHHSPHHSHPLSHLNSEGETEPSSSQEVDDTPHPDTTSPERTGDENEEGDDNGEEDDDEEDSDGDIDPYNEYDDDDDSDDDDEDVDENGLSRTASGRVLWRSDFDRSKQRANVNADVPCIPHTKIYKGHCNVRTVKDVNYFGLQDEYVVSGSDSGHVFIWDRKTSQLLNILEGDGEVVNVVQGHPYEPTMAVSGIDHTIKIFSPDAQLQRNARKGIGVEAPNAGYSSVGFGMRRRRRENRSTSEPAASSNETSRREEDDSDDDDDRQVAPNGLASRKRIHQEYEITSQNDIDRKGGREDAFITTALLTQLARRLQAEEGDEGGEGGLPIVYTHGDEGCSVM